MIDWRIERCEDVRKSTRSMEYCWWKKSCTTWNVIIKISSINSIIPTFGGRSIDYQQVVVMLAFWQWKQAARRVRMCQ